MRGHEGSREVVGRGLDRQKCREEWCCTYMNQLPVQVVDVVGPSLGGKGWVLSVQKDGMAGYLK